VLLRRISPLYMSVKLRMRGGQAKCFNVALLKEFRTLRNESRLAEETPPKELNASLNPSLRIL